MATSLFLAASPACAGPPTERLREFFGQVNTILADPATRDEPLERVVRVRRLVAEFADMRAAAATALGTEWDALSSAQKDDFVRVFGEVLERAYVGRLAGTVRAAGGAVITYRTETVAGNEATVGTTLRGLGGSDLRVDYRMTRASGRWRVRDLVVDGVSTIENYRAQFARVLQRGGVVALLAQLHAKLAEDSLMFAKTPREAPVAAPDVVALTPAAAPPAVPVPLVAAVPSLAVPPDARLPLAKSAPPSPSQPPVVAGVVRGQTAQRDPSVSAPAKPGPRAPKAPVVRVPAPPAIDDPGIDEEPDVLGVALGGVLIGVIGAGGAVVWRGRAGQRVRCSARALRARVAERARRTARRLR